VTIDSQLGEKFKLINVELVSASVEVCLKSWFMGEKNDQWLTQKDFEGFLSKNETEIASMKMIVLKKEAFRDVLTFSTISPQLDSFINKVDHNQPRVLRLKTPESEVHFAAMRILANHSSRCPDVLDHKLH
jgi:hypothetical protein